MFIEGIGLMLKLLTTLARGAAATAEEEARDRHALPILDQQIRDVAEGVARSRRALGLAIAQDEAEARRLEGIEAQCMDLEERAVAALAGGRDDLAAEAAEAIAALEAERDAVREARATFAAETATLRRTVADATRRLAALERGRRIAHAAEAVRRLKAGCTSRSACHVHTLAEAEATLRRLREKQAQEAAAEAILEGTEAAAAGTVADRLEAAGFGGRTRPTAASVLERLRRKAAPATPTP